MKKIIFIIKFRGSPYSHQYINLATKYDSSGCIMFYVGSRSLSPAFLFYVFHIS